MRMLFVNLHCILEISERYLVQLYCQTIEIDLCFIPTFFGNKNNVGQDDIVAVRVFCHCKAWRAVTISIVFFVDPEIVLLMLLFASNTFYLSS